MFYGMMGGFFAKTLYKQNVPTQTIHSQIQTITTDTHTSDKYCSSMSLINQLPKERVGGCSQTVQGQLKESGTVRDQTMA